MIQVSAIWEISGRWIYPAMTRRLPILHEIRDQGERVVFHRDTRSSPEGECKLGRAHREPWQSHERKEKTDGSTEQARAEAE